VLRYIPCMRLEDLKDGMVCWARPGAIAAVLAGLLTASAGGTGAAQQAMGKCGNHNMADMQAVPPPEQLPVPVKLQGIGNSHIEIKATAEAQAWFDQGLSLMHDFWDYEALKAFEQGVRVDPKCAMCWWGLAEAEGVGHGEHAPYGKKALAEAMRLKDGAGESDKLYIEAAQAESVAKKDDTAEQVAILRKLVSEYPHDTQARLFLALALEDGYDDAGEPKSGEKEGIAMLEGILRDAPNDSAANHYWIHAIEPGNHPERALTSAAMLASLAPTSGHMVHMPGHIYYRVGNYPEAERWFAASTAADERYMREQHVGPDDDWNYAHNMMYAIANLMEQGRLADANTLSDHLAATRGQLSNSLYIWSARDQMARINKRLPVALRVGDWDAVMTMAGQVSMEGDKTANLRFLATELTEFAKGMKALDAGNVAEAQASSERMDAGLWRGQQRQKEEADAKAAQDEKDKKDGKADQPVMVPMMPDALGEPLLKSFSIESMELRAGVLVAQGKLEDAKKLYASAALTEKKLGYHEPPMYIRPVGETEAAALLKAKDYAGAKAAYEAALVERPNSGFGLYGLARVKELAGDAAGAREGYQSFLKAWPAADAGLPEVEHARKVLGVTSVAAR
jgi:tetratricopeptide (TPR) repeat protein